MTTILADLKLGVMVADSNVSDGDRCWKLRKVWRHKSHLIGLAGDTDEIEPFTDWWRQGCQGRQPALLNSWALVLSAGGLLMFTSTSPPETIRSGREAIGTGSKAAMAAHEALGWSDPVKAVKIACNHDASSRPPVRAYRL